MQSPQKLHSGTRFQVPKAFETDSIQLTHEGQSEEAVPKVNLSIFLFDKSGNPLPHSSLPYVKLNDCMDSHSINLASLPRSVDRLLVCASIFGPNDPKVTFESIDHFTLKYTSEKGQCLYEHTITDSNTEDAIVLNEFYRFDNGWIIEGLGFPVTGGINALYQLYGVKP